MGSRWSASTRRGSLHGRAVELAAALARLDIPFPSPSTVSIGPGTTTGARDGLRSSCGTAAGRSAGFSSARASTRRPRPRSRRSSSRSPPPSSSRRRSSHCGPRTRRVRSSHGPRTKCSPGGSTSEPWRPGRPEDSLDIPYAAGGAWATVDGAGRAHRLPRRRRPEGDQRGRAGRLQLSGHERHESHRLSLSPRRRCRCTRSHSRRACRPTTHEPRAGDRLRSGRPPGQPVRRLRRPDDQLRLHEPLRRGGG